MQQAGLEPGQKSVGVSAGSAGEPNCLQFSVEPGMSPRTKSAVTNVKA